MQKLTKEQAEWLIKKFYECEGGILNSRNFTPIGVEKIINQCTEQGFPKIEFIFNHQDEDQEVGLYQIYCPNAGHKCIVLQQEGAFTHFDYEQFKQFTESCNEIVEWLNGQNEST